jgi:hypothetical protein
VTIDLSIPIWTIEHVAAAFHLSVDAAREYTYRADFPRPRAGFSRNLWTRQEVLDWFAILRRANSDWCAPGAASTRHPDEVDPGRVVQPVSADRSPRP